MAKRPGSFVFTFSKKNEDVKDIIDNKKKSDKNFVKTDYMCDAVRFYEKYKDNFNNNTSLNENDVIRIVNEILKTNQISVDSDVNIINTSLNLNTDHILDSDLEED
jgi:hypothetical protein|nr:MAG TPA: hypothetical protein [Caudoviricetes sp.]